MIPFFCNFRLQCLHIKKLFYTKIILFKMVYKNTLFAVTCLIITSCATSKKTLFVEVPTEYMNTITEIDLKKYLYIIASDTMEGRETGSVGQKRAAEYLVQNYKRFGVSSAKKATNYYQYISSSQLVGESAEKLNDSENIVAFIKGSEKPNEVIILSAHYDHVGKMGNEIFNGADDDASGTAALLEVAQAFKIAQSEGKGPKRSILFLHLTGEEHGLLGSNYYVKHPLVPLKNTIADINIDMIGRRDYLHPTTNNYVYVIGSDRLSTDLDKVCRKVNEKYVQLDLDYKFNDPFDPNHFYERSDHYNFAKKGIPSVFLFNGIHDDYHKTTDTVDKIEFDALCKRTKLAFCIAWELANMPQKISIDITNKEQE